MRILNESFDSIISKLHAVLEVINDFADEGVGDLIEILVPFSKGILGDVGSKLRYSTLQVLIHQLIVSIQKS